MRSFVGVDSIDDQNCHRLDLDMDMDLQPPSSGFQANPEDEAKSKMDSIPSQGCVRVSQRTEQTLPI
jgi:hypothetical protein